MQLIAALLLAALPLDGGEYVAVVEINHVVDSNGNDRFTQLLYRDSHGLLRDWRYLQQPAMIPDSRTHCAVWRENGQWRMLRAGELYETWTRTDPERDEAQWRPAHTRRKLFD